MVKLLLMLLVLGYAAAARPSLQLLAADPLIDGDSNSRISSTEADLIPVDELPRLLQEVISADAPVPGSAVTPGAYALSDLPQPESDITANTTSNTSDQVLASDTTEQVPESDTTLSDTAAGDTIVVAQGTTSREAATRQAATSTGRHETGVMDSSSSSSGSSSGDKVVEQLSGNQIAGIVVGSAVAVGAAVLGVMAYQKYKRHRVDDYVSRYQRYDGIEMR